MRPCPTALALVAFLAGCGVKAPPRPPLKEGAPAAAAPAGPAACETCGAREPAAAAPAEGDCGCAPPSPFFPLPTTPRATP